MIIDNTYENIHLLERLADVKTEVITIHQLFIRRSHFNFLSACLIIS